MSKPANGVLLANALSGATIRLTDQSRLDQTQEAFALFMKIVRVQREL
jgi:hypothetical protein